MNLQIIFKRAPRNSTTIGDNYKIWVARPRESGWAPKLKAIWSGNMTSKTLIGLATALALAGLTTAAQAETELEKALANGATRMTSDQIAERFTGKTVTFVSHKTGDKFHVYYGKDNDIAGGKIGGDKSNVGFHAVNDRNQMCLGWVGRDLPRVRCMDVLLIDGVVHKFRADGGLSGKIIEFADGNIM